MGISIERRGILKVAYVETLVELLLLFVNYAKTEIDLVGLFEVWLHAHDLRESLFSMFERSVAIVEDANPVPKLGFLYCVRALRA